jgi:hypothetical protein
VPNTRAHTQTHTYTHTYTHINLCTNTTGTDSSSKHATGPSSIPLSVAGTTGRRRSSTSSQSHAGERGSVLNTHTYVCTYLHTNTHKHMHARKHTHTHTCLHAHTHTHVHTQTHMHACVHTHTYTHTHTHSNRRCSRGWHCWCWRGARGSRFRPRTRVFCGSSHAGASAGAPGRMLGGRGEHVRHCCGTEGGKVCTCRRK